MSLRVVNVAGPPDHIEKFALSYLSQGKRCCPLANVEAPYKAEEKMHCMTRVRQNRN